MIKIVQFEKKDFYKIKELLINGFSKSFNKELNSDFLEMIIVTVLLLKMKKKLLAMHQFTSLRN